MEGRKKDKELHCEEGSQEQRVPRIRMCGERKNTSKHRKYYEKLGIRQIPALSPAKGRISEKANSLLESTAREATTTKLHVSTANTEKS